MKKRTKNVIIIVGIISAIFVAVLTYGVFSLYSFLAQVRESAQVEIPASLQETKVYQGSDLLKKYELFRLNKLTHAEIISKSLGVPDEKERQKLINSESAKGIFGYSDIKFCGKEIVAVGKFGGQVFDLNGEVKREILFEPAESEIKVLWWKQKNYRQTLNELRIVDLENDGKCEFVSNDTIDGFAVFNDQGNLIWRYGQTKFDIWSDKSESEQEKEIHVTKASVLDLNDDGISEFIISKKNDGIRAFDINRNEIWFQPDDYPTADFLIADVDGDGATELLEFQGESSAVRDKKTGNVLKKVKIKGGTEGILTYENDKKKQIYQLFDIYEAKLSLYDFDNRNYFKADAPLSTVEIRQRKINFPAQPPVDLGNGVRTESGGTSFSLDAESIYQPKAVWVSLRKDQPKYLAVIASFINLPRSNFYLYDEKGNLVYHELLPENAETVAVLPAANEKQEIIIGGKNTIWRYALN